MGEARSRARNRGGNDDHGARADRLTRREQRAQRRSSERSGRGDTPARKGRKRLACLILLVLLVAAWVIVARSPLTTRLVRPQLATLTGARVELESARLTLDGRLILIGLKLGTPDLGDPEAPIAPEASFLEVDRAVVDLDVSAIIRGRPRAEQIDLENPVVRLSQNTQTGQLNTAGLAIFDSIDTPEGDRLLVLPTVRTAGGVFELGDHDATGYRMVQRFPVAGELSPAADAQAYSFMLRQLGASAGRPISLRGTVSGKGLDVVLDGVTLDEWPAELLPTRVRSFYTSLALEGAIERTTLRIGADGAVTATIEVRGVGVTLPIDPDGPGGTPSGIRLENTTGRVTLGSFGVRTSSLTGEIASVRYEVELDYRGLDEVSPLDARVRGVVELQQMPDVVAMLPPSVREEVEYQLAQFGHPTGMLAIDALVSRGEANADGSADEIGARATFLVRDGVAAFDGFPYPIENLNAVFTVDTFTDRAELVSVSGTNANGTLLSGSGWFEPIGPSAEIELDLVASNMPVDEVLRSAMNERRRALLDELFSETQHDELVERGLVQTQAKRAEAVAELERVQREIDAWVASGGGVARDELARLRERERELRDRAQTPAFEFGARSNTTISLHRELGRANKWTLGITSHLPEAGLVPKNFPLPLVATDVTLEIDETSARVAGGTYRGLTGGWASVEADLAFNREEGASDADSRVEISADAVPIDERLLHAIPGYAGAGPDEAGSIRRMLTRLGLEGYLSCEAYVGLDDQGGLSYNVEVVLDEVTTDLMPAELSPGDPLVSAGAVRLRDARGTVIAKPDLVVVDLVGELHADAAWGPTESEIELLTQIEPRGVLFGPLAGLSLMYARAEFGGIDVTARLEDLAALLSDDAVERVSELRDRYRPVGVVGGQAQVRGVLGAEPSVSLAVDHSRGVAFETGAGRVAFAGETKGEVMVANLPIGMVRFTRFEADVVAAGESSGRVMVDGVLPVRLSKNELARTARTDVQATLEDSRFESAFVRTLMAGAFEGRVPAWYLDAAPAGEFDASLHATTLVGERVPRVRGRLEPRELAISLGGGRAEFEHVSGAVVINDDGARFEDLIAQAHDWRVSLAGNVSTTEIGGLSGALDASLEARGVSESLLVAMPDVLESALRGVELRGDELDITDARVTLEREHADEDIAWRVVGSGMLSGAEAEVGVSLRGVEAAFAFDAFGAGDTGGFRVELDADRLRAAGVRMTNASAVLDAPTLPGPVRIDQIGASVHGGRVAGNGELLMDRSPVSYWLDVQAAGVRAAPVFDDLRAADESEGALLTAPARRDEVEAVLAAERESWDRAEDDSRGLLDANLSMTGEIGNSAATLGRGEIRVSGGSVVALPGLLNLIELSNLTLPVGSKLDLARASFFVDGPVMTFEEISATSRQIELYGYGLVTWPEGEIDLRFNSRAQRPIPVVGPIFQGLRDQFVSTKVTGTTSDPEITAASLAASRTSLNEISDEQRLRLREAERRVRSGQARMREESRRAAERASTPARAPTMQTAPEPAPGG